jgi:hypothetical protein
MLRRYISETGGLLEQIPDAEPWGLEWKLSNPSKPFCFRDGFVNLCIVKDFEISWTVDCVRGSSHFEWHWAAPPSTQAHPHLIDASRGGQPTRPIRRCDVRALNCWLCAGFFPLWVALGGPTQHIFLGGKPLYFKKKKVVICKKRHLKCDTNYKQILKQVIYTEQIFGPDLVLHQARQTLREFINLTGLYTKLMPHIHLSLNKHGWPNLTQRTNIKWKRTRGTCMLVIATYLRE